MRLLSILAASIIATFWGSLANAQSIPRYDVEAYCSTVADVVGGSRSIFNGCIESEQEAYNELKPAWSSLPNKTRSYCDEVARVVGGSYSILQGCIDSEQEAAETTPEFKY